jgi:hypothetical protein
MMKKIAQYFERLHGTPFVVGAMDGSPILIIVPLKHVINPLQLQGIPFCFASKCCNKKMYLLGL